MSAEWTMVRPYYGRKGYGDSVRARYHRIDTDARFNRRDDWPRGSTNELITGEIGRYEGIRFVVGHV